ncbi:MAG TPA: DUF2652 domain-containing protein [Ignavibacteria bacterium]|jgi:class 3 adenylate cyclase
MSTQTYAVFLVADISGYTKFMKMHEISLNHAKQIVVRLLKSIINAARPPLTVAELEGDAVFFYAPSSEKNLTKTAEQVKAQIMDLFNSFKKELYTLREMHICGCPACETAGDLRLKQVIHTGEVEIEKIHKSKKLFGVDVIVVHRMLKNSIPSNEYIMMSDTAYKKFSDFYGLQPKTFRENFEGIGELETQVFFADDIFNLPEIPIKETKKPSFKERIAWRIDLGYHTLLMLLRIGDMKGNYKNIPA